MNRVRIGKDFKILWDVTINGEPISEMYRNQLTLVMVNPRLSPVEVKFFIKEGKVVASITHDIQKYLGVHKLSLWYKGDDGVQSVLDEVDAFSLVRFTSEESWENEDNLDTDVEIELEGNLMVAVKGDSAYESWLNCGYQGTEEDFINWLRADLQISYTGNDYKAEE